jgi:hypothetical protein
MRFWVYQVRDDLDSCVSRVRKWIENRQKPNGIVDTGAPVKLDDSVDSTSGTLSSDEQQREHPISRRSIPSSPPTEVRRSYSRYDRQNNWKKGIHTPFPEEFSPALHHLYEANRLEKEGADQKLIDQELEKARQLDPNATAYYISRQAIINESKRDKR